MIYQPDVDNKIWQKGSAQYFFSQDHLGSTTALTNASGALVERETYDAYGNSTGSALTRYGYTGREREAVTGLMYYRARWYDGQVGRFMSEDPIGQAGGVNQFAYVGNDPVFDRDPSGLCPPLNTGPNLPQKMARCLALAKRMVGPLNEIMRLEKNYNSVKDFLGGYSSQKTLRSGQVIDVGPTKSGGHYRGMMRQQEALRKNWEAFKRECIDDDSNDFRPPPIPADARQYAYKKWTPPHAPDGTPRTFWDDLKNWVQPPPLPGRQPQPCWWCLPWPPPIPVWN